MTLGTTRKEYILRTIADFPDAAKRSAEVVRLARDYIKKRRADVVSTPEEVPAQFVLSYILPEDFEMFWKYTYTKDPEGQESDDRRRKEAAEKGLWTWRTK